MRIFYDKDNEEENVVEAISIKCINRNKDTVLYLKGTKIEEMITKFVLYSILHHEVMSRIFCSNNIILYETEENNHPNWFDKDHWYNTDICSKLQYKVFEAFITNARTDRYNLMCSITVHFKQ